MNNISIVLKLNFIVSILALLIHYYKPNCYSDYKLIRWNGVAESEGISLNLALKLFNETEIIYSKSITK